MLILCIWNVAQWQSVCLTYTAPSVAINKSHSFMSLLGSWSPAPGSVSLETKQTLPLGQMSKITSLPRVYSGLLWLFHVCGRADLVLLGWGPRVTPEPACFKVQIADRSRCCLTRNAACRWAAELESRATRQGFGCSLLP